MTRQHYPGCRPAAHAAGPASGLAILLTLTAALFLAACSTGSGRASAAATASPACTQISAALSDGPDPGADPVGYAEAQIKPLRAIRTGDAALRAAVSHLASDYAAVYDSDGKSSAATKAVKAASREVNSICPGAAS
ncbi:MAG TPA: hypothetical protein VMA73_06240 [Streptosporangiaceae bacterium]|nr:hypothetical protein [Streptosporangiaceae bacterium]